MAKTWGIREIKIEWLGYFLWTNMWVIQDNLLWQGKTRGGGIGYGRGIPQLFGLDGSLCEMPIRYTIIVVKTGAQGRSQVEIETWSYLNIDGVLKPWNQMSSSGKSVDRTETRTSEPSKIWWRGGRARQGDRKVRSNQVRVESQKAREGNVQKSTRDWPCPILLNRPCEVLKQVDH